MAKTPQINTDNNKNSGTIPLSSGETKQNSLLPMLTQIKVTPLMTGFVVVTVTIAAAFAYASRLKAQPRIFYKGGFRPEMTKREAALILGVRGSVTVDKVTRAHRKVMFANHPDAGGNHYLASKINEAKEMLVRKPKSNDDSTFSYTLTVKNDYD